MSKCVIHHMNADSFFLHINATKPNKNQIKKNRNPQPHTNNAESRNISNRSSSVIYVSSLFFLFMCVSIKVYISILPNEIWLFVSDLFFGCFFIQQSANIFCANLEIFFFFSVYSSILLRFL